MKLRLLLNKLRLPGVFFISKYILLPNRDIDMLTVYGKIINLPQTENPTEKEVEYWHSLYLEKLRELFDKYNPLVSDEKQELEIY